MRKLLMGALLFTFASWQAAAQSTSRMEIGFGLGASVYQGDLSPYQLGTLRKSDFSFQAFAGYLLHPALSLRGAYSFSSLRGSDKTYNFGYKPHRNFSFESSVNEVGLHLLFNPRFNNGQEKPGSVVPYLFGGAGLALLSIKRDFSEFDHNWPAWQSWVRTGLAEDSAAQLPTSTVTFPIGVGLRFHIGENVALYAEGSHRFTREEYLDGFSKAANPARKDAFTSAIIGVTFRLGPTTGGRGGRGGFGCPVNVW